MSEENVEIVRTILEAFRRRDAQTIEALTDPEIEWDATRFAQLIPDLTGVYHGVEGARAFWRRWLSPWKDLVFDYELRDGGDIVVALISNQRQWGRHSDIETTVAPYAWVYTLRAGKLVRGCFYPDHASGLEAAGLSE
jgi:ketosteroid isomerase-like protein